MQYLKNINMVNENVFSIRSQINLLQRNGIQFLSTGR